MVVLILFTKVRHFLLFFVNIFRRALCCFRRRRRNSIDAVPLTHIGVVSNNSQHDVEENWNWEDKFENSEPKTIQDHIELYRKKKLEATKNVELPEEERMDLFEDMTPKITKQTKIYVNTNSDVSTSNRLSVVDDLPVETGELREWEDSAGWEGETLDWEAQEALRAKKRQDRERKMWEQQQKRQEKSNRLGARIST